MTKHKQFTTYLVGLLLLVSLNVSAYTPKAEKVVDNVYAIIGPLGQRSKENDGLNNNQGFIVTEQGVILIDSGASKLGAQRIEAAIQEVTDKPIKWVVNTGSQDHRWLGNHYFSSKGAEIIALKRTAKTQKEYSQQQLASLKRFLGDRLTGTIPLTSTLKNKRHKVKLVRGGVTFILRYTDTHFPGDVFIWLPEYKVIFTGDLVYVDRMFSVHPWSSVLNGQTAFRIMESYKPKYIIPGHGQVCDLEKARKDSGDYYDFLVEKIGKAAREMESMDEVINKYAKLPEFQHLKHYDSLHRKNMNRTFLEVERESLK